VDYGANCGNMSSAMGPFAVDEGLVKVSGPEALVRVHNTNTKKIIWSKFPLDNGQAAVDGDLAIPGVAGTGAPVKLEFREPGGATTGKLLPTGNAAEMLNVPGYGRFRVSMVDAANACVFARASDLGIKGTELPEEIDANPELLKKLAAIRIAASIAMGITKTPEEAAKRATVPFVGFVSGPQEAKTLTGERIEAGGVDLTARMMSSGQPHRALPLTCTLCLAVAARVEGTVVNELARPAQSAEAEIRIGMPSGVLTAAASVRKLEGQWHAEQGAFFRTQRRMFDGHVYVRASRVPRLAR
jgi:2-methylaconitate cis-trans-isomerase PrpF